MGMARCCEYMRFNGAMPFQAWILPRFSDTILSVDLLQWGHALSGMDTLVRQDNLASCPKRFNGAMPFQAWIHVIRYAFVEA